MSIQRVSHLCFRVSDLERSRRFYEDVLGFKPLYEIDTVGSPSTRLLGRTDIRLTGVWLERDGFTLQLQQLHVEGLAKPKRDTVEIGYSHVAVRVSNLDTVIERLVAAGADVLTASRTVNATPDGGESGAVFINDPDGIRLELVQIPGDPTGPITAPEQD